MRLHRPTSRAKERLVRAIKGWFLNQFRTKSTGVATAFPQSATFVSWLLGSMFRVGRGGFASLNRIWVRVGSWDLRVVYFCRSRSEFSRLVGLAFGSAVPFCCQLGCLIQRWVL